MNWSLPEWCASPADHTIVHAFSTVSAGIGAGLAELPSTDTQVLMSVQATMIMALAERYSIDLNRTAAAELVLTLGASMVGKKATRSIRNRFQRAPRLVNALAAATITQAIGWAAVAWFRRRAKENEE